MATAYLSLGSNQDPVRHLLQALTELRGRFRRVVASSLYFSPAVGFAGADFLNGAALIDTDLSPVELDDWLHALEASHGRRRDGVRFSDRPLDIDIVYYDDLVLDGPGHLQIPRPEVRHAFVLKPLADIAPAFRDPVLGRTLAELWQAHPEVEDALWNESNALQTP